MPRSLAPIFEEILPKRPNCWSSFVELLSQETLMRESAVLLTLVRSVRFFAANEYNSSWSIPLKEL